VRSADGTFYLVTDHLGSVVSVLDGSGSQVYSNASAKHHGASRPDRPFGQPRLSTSGSPTERGFTGQRELGAAGFADFRAASRSVAEGQRALV
jgi:hypothetical protein